MQRRLPEDDSFVVPHNLYLTMFSPASVNVLAFDPMRGADHARAYATKYCSKPEKWYREVGSKFGSVVVCGVMIVVAQITCCFYTEDVM